MVRRSGIVLPVCTLVLIAVLVAGYGSAQEVTPTTQSETSEQPFEDFDPDNFDNPTVIDNEWFPLKPGTYWVYEGFTVEDGESIPHRVEFVVTDLTKMINGVRTVVAWDRDYADGELEETELAFFAQDNDGTVWHFGQYPEERDAGELVAAPAWIAGLEDARAGISMKAEPKLGTPSYSQGWGPAVDWTDRGQTDQMGLEICVPVACYENVLVITETAASEPGAEQLKYYAPGVGNIRVGWRGDDTTQEELELVEYKQLSPEEMEEVRMQALVLEARAYQVSTDVYAKTLPAEYPPGTPVRADVTPFPMMTPPPESTTAGPKPGHWEGEVMRGEGDMIVFDVFPENEVDNIELELTVDGVECIAEIELTPLVPDGTFTLEATADTNGIRGTFDDFTTASGTVTIHDCSGSPVPAVSGTDEYEWSAQWVSDEVGFGNPSDMEYIV